MKPVATTATCFRSRKLSTTKVLWRPDVTWSSGLDMVTMQLPGNHGATYQPRWLLNSKKAPKSMSRTRNSVVMCVCDLPCSSARGVKIHKSRMHKAIPDQVFKGRKVDDIARSSKIKDQQSERATVSLLRRQAPGESIQVQISRIDHDCRRKFCSGCWSENCNNGSTTLGQPQAPIHFERTLHENQNQAVLFSAVCFLLLRIMDVLGEGNASNQRRKQQDAGVIHIKDHPTRSGTGDNESKPCHPTAPTVARSQFGRWPIRFNLPSSDRPMEKGWQRFTPHGLPTP